MAWKTLQIEIKILTNYDNDEDFDSDADFSECRCRVWSLARSPDRLTIADYGGRDYNCNNNFNNDYNNNFKNNYNNDYNNNYNNNSILKKKTRKGRYIWRSNMLCKCQVCPLWKLSSKSNTALIYVKSQASNIYTVYYTG